MSGLPSREEIECSIKLISPIISHEQNQTKNSKNTIQIIGKGNAKILKQAIDIAVDAGTIPGLIKSKKENSRHKYGGNKDVLFHELKNKFGLNIKESIFKRGISFFVETKAKISNKNYKPASTNFVKLMQVSH